MMTKVKAGESVFVARGFDEGEAENLRIRTQLMIEIEQYTQAKGLTQQEAANLFDTTQARISNIKTGKIDNFTIDILVNMLSKAGCSVNVSVSDAA
jgi:predicted XRE-type DNA-binding protein